MNYAALLQRDSRRPVRVGVVGVGDFGVSLLNASRTIANLEIVLLCDRDSQRVQSFLKTMEVPRSRIKVVEDLADANDCDLDVLVEATGRAAAAATHARWAIDHGAHVVMVSKEAGIVVGPQLHRLAAQKGLVYSEVEGDQPSLLITLLGWARTLGLQVIAAGKSSEYDFVVSDKDQLKWHDRGFSNSGLLPLLALGESGWRQTWNERAERVAELGIPRRTVPDFCEMGIVCNATGLLPHRPSLSAPLLRPTELADAFQLREHDGLLSTTGCVEVFNCLRRPDEASFAGGVFIVVACSDAVTWELLRKKGHCVAKNGRTAMLSNPRHLLGIEAPISILVAAILKQPTGGLSPQPRVDVVARATRDFQQGDTLTITDESHHEVGGLAPELLPARCLTDDAPCPYYLATGQRLNRDIQDGELITVGDVEIDRTTDLWELRCEQDLMLEDQSLRT